jgi:hypothetical protein
MNQLREDEDSSLRPHLERAGQPESSRHDEKSCTITGVDLASRHKRGFPKCDNGRQRAVPRHSPLPQEKITEAHDQNSHPRLDRTPLQNERDPIQEQEGGTPLLHSTGRT